LTGNERNARRPKMMIAATSTLVATGLMMKIRDTFMF
jgi:hypothetical protein